MKLLNKIFKKGSNSSPNSSGGEEWRNGRAPLSGSQNSRLTLSPYHCASTPFSPRTGTVSAAKVLRILGAENQDEQNQIIRTMAETMAEPDSTDVSFEEDYFPPDAAPSLFNESHRRLSDSRYSTDTDTFDRSSSRSMSPTSSSRLSPANDPWCRSPQHSPRASCATYNSNQSRALPLPVPGVPLRERVGNSLRVATGAKPLPLPPGVENLSSEVSARLNNSSNNNSSSSQSGKTFMETRGSPLPSPSTTSPRVRSFPPQSPRFQLSPQRSPVRSLKCQKLNELGRGSFATVYEGFMDDGSFCAIKVIHDSSMADSFKEVALLSQLNHQNIVRYLGSCIDENGSLCILLELMKCSLKFMLNKLGTGFEESTIRSYTRQILHGLAYLHDHSTIHRDIKCANILVDSQGQVKLADFGVAKQTPEASSLKGTPSFMAPEVMTPNPSRRSYGTAVDIWSLGCTVLEMASGQAPWSDLGFAFYFKLSRGEAPPIPDTLSPAVRNFVQRCLCFKPEDRPTARELLFHEFVIDAPSSVPFSSPPVMSPRASPMHSGSRNLIPDQPTYYLPIEGLRRNGNLNLTREDPGFSPAITRPQPMIFRSLHSEPPELLGLVL